MRTEEFGFLERHVLLNKYSVSERFEEAMFVLIDGVERAQT